jgi:hypothetical protein
MRSRLSLSWKHVHADSTQCTQDGRDPHRRLRGPAAADAPRQRASWSARATLFDRLSRGSRRGLVHSLTPTGRAKSADAQRRPSATSPRGKQRGASTCRGITATCSADDERSNATKEPDKTETSTNKALKGADGSTKAPSTNKALD